VATRKKRIPVPQALSDEVLFANDNTCCFCRRPGRTLQIHHIDNDPSHNNPANLAVLCSECHEKTLVRGGFGRQLNSGLVVKYRDDWVARVQEKRAIQAGRGTEVTVRLPERTMTPQRAREHAQRLRSLYKPILNGVLLLQRYVGHMCTRPFESESLSARKERLNRYLDAAFESMDSTLEDIRVEPGSYDVCEQLDSVIWHYHTTMTALVKEYEKHGLWRSMTLNSCKASFDEAVGDLQRAIQDHIQTLDDLT
jgi:hypothetical protein